MFKYYIDRCKFSKYVPLYKVDDVLFMKGTPRLNDWGLSNYVI